MLPQLLSKKLYSNNHGETHKSVVIQNGHHWAVTLIARSLRVA